MGGLDYLVIKPVLKYLVATSDSNKNPANRDHLILLLTHLEIAKDRLREGSDKESKYLLEGEHYYMRLSYRDTNVLDQTTKP